MPTITVIRYEGSDEQILRLLAQGIPAGLPAMPPPTTNAATAATNGSGPWDEIARRFERHLSTTALSGKPGQKNAMLAWLQGKNGEIELKKLWKAAGVANQHDYAGIGSSLTKNMKKAGGPRDWYQWHQGTNGEWIYKIMPELFSPLRSAFGVA